MSLNTNSTVLNSGTGDRTLNRTQSLNIQINNTNELSIMPYLVGLKMTSISNKYTFDLKFYKNNSKNIDYNATVSLDTKVT